MSAVVKMYILALSIFLQVAASSSQGSKATAGFYGDETKGERAKNKDEWRSRTFYFRKPFEFFDEKATRFSIDNNGMIILNERAAPAVLEIFNSKNPFRGEMVVAPFFADSDLSAGGALWYNHYFYRKYTDLSVLKAITDDIRSASPRYIYFTAVWAFTATWVDVKFYGADEVYGKDKRNSFQAVIAQDKTGENSFVIFNYKKLQWTTGVGQDGNGATGLGGQPAIATIHGGNPQDVVLLPGSRTADVINLTAVTNCGVPGRFIYKVAGSGLLLTAVPSLLVVDDVTIVRDNATTEFRCSKNLRISCQGLVITEMDDPQRSVLKGVLSKNENATCSCYGTFRNKQVRESYHIATPFGPEKVMIETNDTTFDACPGSEVEVRCWVDKVYPSVWLEIYIEGITVQSPLEIKSNDFTFRYRPETGGNFSFWCTAVNSVVDDLKVVSETLTINVRKPPTQWPVIKTGSPSDFTLYTNSPFLRSGPLFTENKPMWVSCEVGAGFPEDVTTTLECGGIFASNNSIVVHRNVSECVCRGDHVTGCYDLETRVPVRVNYGPDEVVILHTPNRTTYNMCTDEDVLTLECRTRGWNYNGRLVLSINSLHDNSSLVAGCEDSCKDFSYVISPYVGGVYDVTCEAVDMKGVTVGRSRKSLQLTFNQPPSAAPVISLNGKPVGEDLTTLSLVEGDTYDVTCHVTGGFPQTTETLIECAGVPVHNNTFVFSRDMSHHYCRCYGNHVSGCYKRQTKVKLDVYSACATQSSLTQLQKSLINIKLDESKIRGGQADVVGESRTVETTGGLEQLTARMVRMEEDLTTLLGHVMEVKRMMTSQSGPGDVTQGGQPDLVEKEEVCYQPLEVGFSSLWDVFSLTGHQRQRRGVTQNHVTTQNTAGWLWYYDSKSLKCLQFYYKGFGGNQNRFSTLSMCQEKCY